MESIVSNLDGAVNYMKEAHANRANSRYAVKPAGQANQPTSGFGQPSTSAFGSASATTTSAFGQPSTTGAFGSSASPFGQSSFGQTQPTSAFGSTPTTTTTSAFGQPSA